MDRSGSGPRRERSSSSAAVAPLRSGFVNDTHTNGVVNGAREGYHLNGAQPGVTYEVQLGIFASLSCAGSPFATVTSSQITTNGVGNGNADAFFPAGPPNNPPVQVGVVWQFLSNGVAVYATDCVAVTADYAVVGELRGRVTVLDKSGAAVARLGMNTDAGVGGNQIPPELWRLGILGAPHGVAVNGQGDLFVSEFNAFGRVHRTLLPQVPP